MTLDQLAKRCGGGVSLFINDHLAEYRTVEEYLAYDEFHREVADLDYDAATRQAMVTSNTIYRLQFYPITPVGFYVVWGISLDDVMAKAEECLKGESS